MHRRALEACGVEVVAVPARRDGADRSPAAMATLGGRAADAPVQRRRPPAFAEALAEADLIDAVTLMTGPVEAGPAGGLPALGPS